MPPAPQQGSNVGLMLTVILIIAALVVGAVYFYRNRTDNSMEADTSSVTADNAETSSSDTTTSIESDLNSTNIDNVDYDLNAETFNAS